MTHYWKKQEQIDSLAKQNEILIKTNQDLQERMDDQAKATLDFHARTFEEIQDMKKEIREKDAQLNDLRNASIMKQKNEEIARLEAKLGQTTERPTQDTHKPKEPSWWKDKERMDNRNKPKKPPGSKGYHNWAVYQPPP